MTLVNFHERITQLYEQGAVTTAIGSGGRRIAEASRAIILTIKSMVYGNLP